MKSVLCPRFPNPTCPHWDSQSVLFGMLVAALIVVVWPPRVMSADSDPLAARQARHDLEILRNGKADEKARTLERLRGACNADQETVRAMAACLGDKDTTVAQKAAAALASLDGRSLRCSRSLSEAAVVPTLLARVARENDATMLTLLTRALAKAGEGRDDVVHRLEGLTEHPDRTVAMTAHAALAALQEKATPHVQALTAHISTRGDGLMFAQATQLLAALGPKAREGVPRLIEFVEQNESSTDEVARGRAAAVRGILIAIHEPRDRIVPLLLERVADARVSVTERARILQGLSTFPDEEERILQAITPIDRFNEDELQAASLGTAATLGYEQGALKDAVMVALRSEKRALQVAAIRAIGRCGLEPGDLLNNLAGFLKDEDPSLRCAALSEVAEARLPCKDLTVVLLAGITDKSAWARAFAANRLGDQLCDRPAIVDALVALLGQEREGEVAIACARSLAKLGPDAKRAIPALVAAQKEWASSCLDPRAFDVVYDPIVAAAMGVAIDVLDAKEGAR